MSGYPYKDYYEAMKRGDEWSGVEAEKARKKIEKKKESDSWTGDRTKVGEEYEFSGGG